MRMDPVSICRRRGRGLYLAALVLASGAMSTVTDEAQAGGERSAVDRRYYDSWGLSPDDPEAIAHFAARMAEVQRFTEAADYYRQALRLRPDYPEAHFYFAMMLTSQNKPDEALPHFQAVVGSGIEYESTAHTNMGLIYGRRGEGDKALTHFQRAVELDPDQSDARFNLGLSLLRHQRPEAALEQFEAALPLAEESGDRDLIRKIRQYLAVP